MNRSYFALFVALLIHIVLLLLFWLLGTIAPEIKKTDKTKENRIKISLKEMPKKVKNDAEIKNIQKKPLDIAPPMPKGSQLKEIVEPAKKPPIKYEPKKIQKQKEIREKLNIKEPPINYIEPKSVEIPKPKIEEIPSSKPYIPFIVPLEKKEVKKIKENKKREDKSFDWMYEDQSTQDKSQDNSKKETRKSSVGNSNLKELYGDKFGKLTPGEQKYLIDNQEIMRRITQEVLNRVAKVNLSGDINVNRVNIIEFYLHPNGDMSDFRFLQKSGYYILDNTTKETIEYAYSRYPRPSEKILIRYNVFYNLARY